MYLPRYYEKLDDYLEPGKVLMLFGPRRVGKTTLLNNFLADTKLKYRLESGDNQRVHEQLSYQNFDDILDFAAGYELIAIDEAQTIPNIGMALKILADQRPDIKVVVTGSYGFDLNNKLGETLTGRLRKLTIYPIAQLELATTMSNYDLRQTLSQRLIFGSYPNILTAKSDGDRQQLITEITDSYLLKDILTHENIKNSKIMRDLLRLLALQLGSQVSINELGTKLGLHNKTIEKYLGLLEKSFVILRLDGFSRNLRSEIKRMNKYYFYDLGVRNALLGAFAPLDQRTDTSALWENFLLIERKKFREYSGLFANEYFWRTYAKAEIDLIEEYAGKLHAYECKLTANNKLKAPNEWSQNYPGSEFEIISNKNYLSFIIGTRPTRQLIKKELLS